MEEVQSLEDLKLGIQYAFQAVKMLNKLNDNIKKRSRLFREEWVTLCTIIKILLKLLCEGDIYLIFQLLYISRLLFLNIAKGRFYFKCSNLPYLLLTKLYSKTYGLIICCKSSVFKFIDILYKRLLFY